MKRKYINLSVQVNDTVDGDIDIETIFEQLSEQDLKSELQRRQKGLPRPTAENYSAQDMLGWFEDYMVSDYDKIYVLDRIDFQLILQTDGIKNNL